MSEQDQSRRDGVINPQNNNFDKIQYGKFDALIRQSYKSTEEDSGYKLHVPFGLYSPLAVTPRNWNKK